jgi:hypothetical protein
MLSLFLTSACELESGDADAADVGTNDTPAQCVSDGFCDTNCTSDPDCSTVCDCDLTNGFCNVASSGSSLACSCDDDCASGTACSLDTFCDTLCASDPDCGSCACDRDNGRCDAADDYTDPDNAGIDQFFCACDPDCVGETDACPAGDGCDPYCGARDGDCSCNCDFFDGICEADNDHSTDKCTCDDACAGNAKACTEDGHCDTFCDPTNPVAGGTEYICADVPDCSESSSSGRCRD